MSMIRDKRGIEVKVLIGVIILVISIVIILWFYYQFNWKGTIDKDVCHQSVVLRSGINFGAIEFGKKTIPLRCKTEKVCISMGENCELKSTKDNPVTTIKINSNKEKAKEEIMDIFANSMYDCHWMLGEGKLSFVPHDTFLAKQYCLICSRIVFDDKVKNEIKEIKYEEFFKHLQEKKTLSGQSYLSYLYGGWTDSKNSMILFNKLKESSNDNDFKNLDFSEWKIDLSFDNGFVILASQTPEGVWKQIITTAIVVASVPFALTGIGAPVTVVVIGTAGTGAATFWFTHEKGYKFSSPIIYPYDAIILQELRCYSFETAP